MTIDILMDFVVINDDIKNLAYFILEYEKSQFCHAKMPKYSALVQ